MPWEPTRTKATETAKGTVKGYLVATNCRFDPEQYSAIAAFAKVQGLSLAEAIRTLVEWGLEEGRG